MIGTSAGVAASLLHGYLFLKMEASREPVARFWGPVPWHRGAFMVRFIRTQVELNPLVVRVFTSGVVSASPFRAAPGVRSRDLQF